MAQIKGKILKSVGGFFHVEAPDGLLQCTARGLFRHKDITPCAGDNVIIEFTGNSPVIIDVLERKNHIIRPPLSNIDACLLVTSTVKPSPNLLILDKFIAILESKDIEPVHVFTKTDIEAGDELAEIYRKAGFHVFGINNMNAHGITELRKFLQFKTTALIGNTGVGKSSTLNSLFPALSLETAEISKKLGRGKHTTRQVELFGFNENSYVADTPGFSTVETARYYGKLPPSEVALYFREFKPYIFKCRFGGCSHTKEEGCAVITARDNGNITASRFESYVRIYEEARVTEQTYKQQK